MNTEDNVSDQVAQSAVRPPSRIWVVALLSGGLDSSLVVRLMLDQGLRVLALNFVSPFCTCSPRKNGGCRLAAGVARNMGVELRVMSKGLDYLRIVERPRFGYGRGLNPCIDCRIFILRKAEEVMREIGAVCVVTGEVLGQRPMSQHRRALDLIERESGLAGRLLRPLSAHRLPATIPEQEGLIHREQMLDLSGRTRSPQLAIAKERGVEVFGCPSGGCLLTDAVIARRLKDVFDRCPGWDERDARLTTLGRHFRFRPGLKVILGRDAAENARLEQMAGPLPVVSFTQKPGPTAVLRGPCEGKDLITVGRLLRHFAPKVTGECVEVCWKHDGQETTWTAHESATADEVKEWTI
jgi:tRNA(Ile)-lysidine synthase TilS/MesJ